MSQRLYFIGMVQNDGWKNSERWYVDIYSHENINCQKIMICDQKRLSGNMYVIFGWSIHICPLLFCLLLWTLRYWVIIKYNYIDDHIPRKAIVTMGDKQYRNANKCKWMIYSKICGMPYNWNVAVDKLERLNSFLQNFFRRQTN